MTSAAGLAAALRNDPVSAVPRDALLVVALAAAVLAITGFCVSIAASVRLRRPENALLAALGVPPGAAARQLGLEKLMLSVPSALAGSRSAPCSPNCSSRHHPDHIRHRTGAAGSRPVRLAADGRAGRGRAVIPVLAAALAMARRPDPAAALRAAEAA